MSRRFISLLIIISLAFTVFTVNANAVNEGIGSFVDQLSEFSSEDRENLFIILYPMIIVDSGVDGLISIINTHSGGGEGMFAPYVEKVLKYTTKEEVNFYLNSLKIIPEKVRNKYFTMLKNREEKNLSDSGAKKFNFFMNKVYEEIPKIESMLIEDDINEKVVAGFLGIIPAANNNIPLLSVDDEYKFSLNKIYSGILNKAEALAKDSGKELDLENGVKIFADFINKEISSDSRKDISEVFTELGICKMGDEEDLPEEGSSNTPGGANDSSDDAVLLPGAVSDTTKTAFTDIEGWYKPYITILADKGIVSGRGDGKFYPNDTVKREEFVKMICNAIGLPPVDTATDFADVDANAWYAPYINTAYYMGIIKGQSAVTFGVGENILRQDAALICNNIITTLISIDNTRAPFADDAAISDYAKTGVYNLASVGIINGDNNGNFNPKSNLTRGESAKIICELIKFMEKSR